MTTINVKNTQSVINIIDSGDSDNTNHVEASIITAPTINVSLDVVQSNVVENWVNFVNLWTTPPTLNTSITGGDVYNYTNNSITRYRFIPNPYDSNQDTFYASFDGTNLTSPLATRGTQ